MARIKNLDALKQETIASEVVLGYLPEKIRVENYALQKGYKVNELVKKVHKSSYEWYGFLLGKKENPEVVVDIGLGESRNTAGSTEIQAEEIGKFLDSLPADYMINGWIHSHGNLGFRAFSGTDDRNMATVLSFVSLLTRKPLIKREVLIKDLSVLVEGRYDDEALRKGSVSVVLDGEASKAKLYETVFGSFSYSIVVGDEKWHADHISYERKSLLTGERSLTDIVGELDLLNTEKTLSAEDLEKLEEEVKTKIKPYRFAYDSWKGSSGRKRRKGKKSKSFIDRFFGLGSEPDFDPSSEQIGPAGDDFEAFPTSTGVLYRPKRRPIFDLGDYGKEKGVKGKSGNGEHSEKDDDQKPVIADQTCPNCFSTTLKCNDCRKDVTPLRGKGEEYSKAKTQEPDERGADGEEGDEGPWLD